MHSPALAHWQRLLWGPLPDVKVAPPDAAPFIADGHLHLPRAEHWHTQRAAAAHAAAHQVYSPRAFDGEGLVPIARVVLAVLEDARVETLAMRELPGLARLWQPLHTATPDSGSGFEPLLQRLARALVDPDYQDPHAWVRKGRRLFFLDESLRVPALRCADDLRGAALALGHDIGQSRLPFNGPANRAAPAYRDDHRWMWPAEQLRTVSPPPERPAAAGGAAVEPPEPTQGTATRLPEWDRLIRRMRRDWVTVLEGCDPAASALAQAHPGRGPAPRPAVAKGVLQPLRRLAWHASGRELAEEGELLDVDALVAWHLARRAGRIGDVRVMRRRQRRGVRAAVWLLVDQSASSAEAASAPGTCLRDVAAQAAGAMAAALQHLGVAYAVSGFSSHGRHAVRLHALKTLRRPAPAALLAQLQALRCSGSTRLGAVLRHVVRQIGHWHEGPRWVLLLSDAQAHDIDVHDPIYLAEDARRAVQAAARSGVQVACLTLIADAGPFNGSRIGESARCIFGPRRAWPLASLQALPIALQRVLADLP